MSHYGHGFLIPKSKIISALSPKPKTRNTLTVMGRGFPYRPSPRTMVSMQIERVAGVPGGSFNSPEDHARQIYSRTRAFVSSETLETV